MIEKNDDPLSSIPNVKYQKLFNQFKEIDTLGVEQWRTNHILGYFVFKYKAAYNLDYQFKFNTPAPSKSFEIWQVKALSGKLSSNPQILKDYIDWIFKEKAPQIKRRFTSVSFINKEEFLNEYKWSVLTKGMQALNLDRSTLLPSNYQDILIKAGSNIKTYGDLSFLYQSYKTGSLENNEFAIFDPIFHQLQILGLDFTILEKII